MLLRHMLKHPKHTNEWINQVSLVWLAMSEAWAIEHDTPLAVLGLLPVK